MASVTTDATLTRMNKEMTHKYYTLKTKQEDILKVANSNDVLGVLPTGYGKTVVIQALPYLTPDNKCCIVINGLNAILSEQESRFGRHCITITDDVIHVLEKGDGKNESEYTVARLKSVDKNVRYILSHPENILHPLVKKILMTDEWSNHITHAVIDEAHLVLSWGKQEFRPFYQKLGLLKTIIRGVRVIALTATANQSAQTKISTALQLSDPVVITESPDRPNVFLEVKKRPPSTGGMHTSEDSMFKTIDPYIETLVHNGVNFPKTIVYVPLKWCGILHHRAATFRADVDENEMRNYVAQYHAPQSTEMKAMITAKMRSGDSIKLVFATEAYGTGIDVPDVKEIVHVGPPNNLETYVQEIGRSGRNGQQSSAVLYYNSSDISSNREHLQEEMKGYVTNTTICRREYLLQYFGFKPPVERQKHLCCDICQKLCQCTNCSEICSTSETSTACKTSKKHINVVKHMLLQYFSLENSAISSTYVVPHLHTGLSDSFADLIAKTPAYEDSDKLLQDYPMLKKSYASNIANILSQVNKMNL